MHLRGESIMRGDRAPVGGDLFFRESGGGEGGFYMRGKIVGGKSLDIN